MIPTLGPLQAFASGSPAIEFLLDASHTIASTTGLPKILAETHSSWSAFPILQAFCSECLLWYNSRHDS